MSLVWSAPVAALIVCTAPLVWMLRRLMREATQTRAAVAKATKTLRDLDSVRPDADLLVQRLAVQPSPARLVLGRMPWLRRHTHVRSKP